MARFVGSFLLLALSVILLVAAWRGHVTGELRAGLSGFRPYRPNRVNNPAGFYSCLALYVLLGFGGVLWAMLALVGIVGPIPLR